MKIAIVGSRTVPENQDTLYQLNQALRTLVINPCSLTIISGGAKGVDRVAKELALAYKIPYLEYLPDWEKHGKAAGPIRNLAMAEACDMAIIIWDGRSAGTRNMMQSLASSKKPFFCLPMGEG